MTNKIGETKRTEAKKRVDIVSIKMIRESSILYEPRKISSPKDIVELCNTYLSDLDREELIVVSLNTKNEPITINRCSRGSLNSSIVHPREVFKIALLSNAKYIIVSHNHPSGDITPSKEDINMTKRLKECGDIMGIRVLDHIIIGGLNNKYFSFKEGDFL